MTKVLFDIESTGFLRRGSQIHCIVARDLNTPEDVKVFDTVQDNVADGVKYLEDAELLVGHNIAGYDIPLLLELFPNFKSPKVSDTLILSRIYFSTLVDHDFNAQYSQRDLPKKLYGSHSLKAWGIRLGEYKGDFAESNDWHTYSPEMLDYCCQDTLVNLHLYHHLLKTGSSYH